MVGERLRHAPRLGKPAGIFEPPRRDAGQFEGDAVLMRDQFQRGHGKVGREAGAADGDLERAGSHDAPIEDFESPATFRPRPLH